MNFLAAARQHLGLHAESFGTWCAVIGGALGNTLDAGQAEAFRRVFRRSPLASPCRELWLAVGRRGGKNYVTARLAIYLALFRRWTLAPGEVGVVLLLAVDRAQARVAFTYIRGALESDALLWAEVANVTTDTITLRNGVEIQVATSDFASVRGRTIVTAILDEFAFWPDEQATEVLRALRPGMASQPQAMLIVISSAYAMHGAFYDAFRKFFGTDDPRVLFGRATTRDLNPTIDAAFIAEELARDPAAAAAEYLSEFRSDLESFLDVALVDQSTRVQPRDIPYRATLPNGTAIAYKAAIDASGGRGDATAAAIAHIEGDRVVLDAVRRWPSPHDPQIVAREVAAFLAEYRLDYATSDAYAAEFATSVYRTAGVVLSPSDQNRSEIYLSALPLFTSGRIEIPDDPILRRELLGLERRTSRSGRDSIDHRPGAHDDVANAAMLAAVAVARSADQPFDVEAIHTTPLTSLTGYLGDPANASESRFTHIDDIRSAFGSRAPWDV